MKTFFHWGRRRKSLLLLSEWEKLHPSFEGGKNENLLKRKRRNSSSSLFSTNMYEYNFFFSERTSKNHLFGVTMVGCIDKWVQFFAIFLIFLGIRVAHIWSCMRLSNSRKVNVFQWNFTNNFYIKILLLKLSWYQK